ncbi:MAG: hypothetical protein HYZ11_03780 [Candidatus Tectomicrobia bacterium]|uniref:Uncharacterized protein n=1 Tax=Tectimicrobiota bacterium TaxID=2528274 RepID=A0A932HWA4_UNCTE|nr:hypothetical protein [Candidatus Tectomicrobia bacterium]
MRQATDNAIADLARHGEGRRALVLYHLTNAHGRRVFCRAVPPDLLVGQGGQVWFLDGGWTLDGQVALGEGSEALLGVHAWVIDGGSFLQGRLGSTSPLEAFREKELSGFTLTLSNAPDGEGHPRMGRILAQEPVVGGRLDVRVGFAGRSLEDVLPLASFIVRRVVERRGAVVLECEGA